LNTADGRVKFARILYNILCVDVDQEQNNEMEHAIRLLKDKVDARRLKSMHTKDGDDDSADDDSADDDSAGGGDGGDRAQLRAQGYKVESDVIVDCQGIKWEPISKVPVNPFLPVLRYANARHLEAGPYPYRVSTHESGQKIHREESSEDIGRT
jgi:hypothetical protein